MDINKYTSHHETTDLEQRLTWTVLRAGSKMATSRWVRRLLPRGSKSLLFGLLVLSCGIVGPNSLTRNQNWAPALGVCSVGASGPPGEVPAWVLIEGKI